MDSILKITSSIQQPRSRFQIEKFVIGQHDTVEMQFYQLCLELHTSIFSLKRTELERQKAKIKIDKLRSTGDPEDEIDAQILELNMKETDVAINGAKAELSILIEIWDAFEHKFSRQEIESSQEEYWTKRLIRQASSQAIGSGAVDMGQVEALAQIGALEEFISIQKGGDDNGKIYGLESKGSVRDTN